MAFGQTLGAGQKLTTEGGLFALSVTDVEILFSFDSNPPITYYSGSYFSQRLENDTPIGLEFYNGRLVWYRYSYLFEDDRQLQYVRLGADGHLRGYVWKEQSSEWKEVDSLKEYIDYCDYPVACGNYGICRNAQCSCPVPKSINGTNYFKRINDSLPDRVGAP